ncbi:class I SAM-dependent methyltransferase [Marivirga sp. S37H4]|uniref:Class I SAM-dependent methyltransferase n=1 Tax=Marivirga aurantiaca TaxID=2802615 RepID=A0A935C900_9BACT|nr:class I SAM-dependent methyltransferase [Marivirga aurantiaca]MBK6263983.1 class I SAM-dependent methyltransferase [Marivirga aurantiaca]
MNLFLLKEWLIHFHLKTDEHSLHSPFFYRFYKDFLHSSPKIPLWEEIEHERSNLLASEEVLRLKDYGAGSKVMVSNQRKVKDIAKNSLSSPRFSQLLYTLIRHFKFKEIIELGTCLGINTAYMAKANPQAQVYTFEGDENLIKVAKGILKNEANVDFIAGNIDQTLADHLSLRNNKIDLVYIDANHTYKATINYFHQLLAYHHPHSIFIFDDIHWSKEMKKAWNEIKSHTAVSTSVDIFDAGMVFFNPDFRKQDFILEY